MKTEELVELITKEVDTLEEYLKDQNWEGIYGNLYDIPLNLDQIEGELQTDFKNLLQKIKDTLEENEESVDKETFMYLQEMLEDFFKVNNF